MIIKIIASILKLVATMIIIVIIVGGSFYGAKVASALEVQRTLGLVKPPLEPAYLISCIPNDTVCNVYLTTKIEVPDRYLSVIALIEEAPAGSTVNLHLIGNGGEMSTVNYFYNAIKESKADVNTIIEGPVYSAHAFIAMFGTHVISKDTGGLMFHLPAAIDPNTKEAIIPTKAKCFLYKGKKDRGQDLVKKCESYADAEAKIYDKIFEDKIYPYMTADEKKRMSEGHDIMISGQEMNRRLYEKRN